MSEVPIESRSAGSESETIWPGPLWPRRRVLRFLAVAGIGSVVFRRALVALAQDRPKVTSEMIDQAEWVTGLDLTEDERKLMLEGVNELLEDYAKLREIRLTNDVAPALRFEVLAARRPAGGDAPSASDAASSSAGADGSPAESAAAPRGSVSSSDAAAAPDARSSPRPTSEEDLAFATVGELSALLRGRQVSSVELTRVYLDRLRRYDPQLLCVISYTEELALQQAERADREIAAGRHRGPLHGVPWGAKDLLAVPGYRTTWGAALYKDQMRDETSTVAARLEQAGAVLAAKLTLGALAWGDVWYGGTTKNPWKTDQGSSGSSAGPGAATAAGLVGFAIGTETWGSIVSPCTRCGVSGLRPTFGRVSRHGAMALSWSMDKIGPMARSVEDCALIFGAIQGSDGLDPTAVDRPFEWPPSRDVRKLRVGYVESMFEEDRAADVEDEDRKARAYESQSFDHRTLDTLREMGVQLRPIELPSELPVGALSLILTAEASTAFDELTRSGRDDLLVRQIARAWPNVFRQGQMISAVEYLRANRIRTLLMNEMERVMSEVDVYVSPTFGGDNLLMTNLTGHPQVVLPNGFRAGDGTPTSITFTGTLFGETDILALARAYQEATDFHRRRPQMDGSAFDLDATSEKGR